MGSKTAASFSILLICTPNWTSLPKLLSGESSKTSNGTIQVL